MYRLHHLRFSRSKTELPPFFPSQLCPLHAWSSGLDRCLCQFLESGRKPKRSGKRGGLRQSFSVREVAGGDTLGSSGCYGVFAECEF